MDVARGARIAALVCFCSSAIACGSGGGGGQDAGTAVDDQGQPDQGRTPDQGQPDLGSPDLGVDACVGVMCPPFQHCEGGVCVDDQFCFVDATCPPDTVCRNQRCIPNDVDYDMDGFLSDVDCDEMDVEVNPDGMETCDGVDDDCNGMVDDGPVPQLCPATPGLQCLANGTCGCPGIQLDIGGTCQCPFDRTDLLGPVRSDCECVTTPARNEGASCASPINIGDLEDVASGSSTTVIGSLSAPGQEAWYRFRAVDDTDIDSLCENFFVRVAFEMNMDNAFELVVRQGSCSDTYCDYGTEFTRAVDFARTGGPGQPGQCPCGPAVDDRDTCGGNTMEYFVGVRRRAGASEECGLQYEIEISNAEYSTN